MIESIYQPCTQLSIHIGYTLLYNLLYSRYVLLHGYSLTLFFCVILMIAYEKESINDTVIVRTSWLPYVCVCDRYSKNSTHACSSALPVPVQGEKLFCSFVQDLAICACVFLYTNVSCGGPVAACYLLYPSCIQTLSL